MLRTKKGQKRKKCNYPCNPLGICVRIHTTTLRHLEANGYRFVYNLHYVMSAPGFPKTNVMYFFFNTLCTHTANKSSSLGGAHLALQNVL